MYLVLNFPFGESLKEYIGVSTVYKDKQGEQNHPVGVTP